MSAQTPAKTTKNTKKAPVKGKTQAGKKTAPKKQEVLPVKNQHRELWIIILFVLSLILLLSVFGIKGVLLEALSSFCRGIFGFGAYVLPVSVLVCSLIILFAHGKPIASRICCTLFIPPLLGMLVHLIFSNVELTKRVIPKLYTTGITMDSGGVISGGLAAALGAAISDVGGVIIVILLLTYCFMRLFNIKVTDVLEYFVGARDEAIERRELKRKERDEYEAAEEERLALEKARAAEEAKRIAASAPRPAQKREVFDAESGRNIPVGQPEPQPKAEEPKKKRPFYDIPLDTNMPAAAPVGEIHGIPLSEDEIIRPDTDKKPQNNTIDISADDYEPEEAPQTESEYEYIESDFDDYEEPDNIDPESGEIIEVTDEDEQPLSDEQILESEESEPANDIPTVSLPLAKPAPINSMVEPVVVDTHKLTTGSELKGEEALAQARATVKQEYEFPSIDMLHEDVYVSSDDATEELRTRSHKLADTLQSFGVKAQISNVIRGPSVTRYEIMLDRGVKYSRITSLQDDIALALGATGVRIAAIPDKYAVGIEVPNKIVQTVYLREVLTSKNMADNKSKLAFALGKDITGTSIVGDISKMPHMLIAGTTGSGKSVCINAIIVSILYRASPEEVKLIMIDPKMVELGTYNGIPHLLVPVVTDYKKAAGALNWAVMEMDRRYKQLFDVGARDVDSYNRIMEKRGEPKLPRIVIIIDELADLMMMAAKEIEESICRIAQKARAAGMHLIIATQRPSADVLTGLMKSNISSRIAFAVSSAIESRIILDQSGADKLIGRGDMLFFPLGYPKPVRVQGCYLSTEEVEEVTEFIKGNGVAEYSDEIIQHMEHSMNKDEDGGSDDDDETDDMFFEAVDVVMQSGQASATMLQRKLRLGYARASRIIDQMETRGIVGPYDGARPRQLLLGKGEWQEMKARRTI